MNIQRTRIINVLLACMAIISNLVPVQGQLNPSCDVRITTAYNCLDILKGQPYTDQTDAVEITVITSLYTYPTSISPDGTHVSGSLFGGAASYYWSAITGLIQIPGTAYGVSGTGVIGGYFSNSTVQYNGNNVETAGTCNPLTQVWSFTGMNPAVPALFSTDYNTGWDITADGSTIVGMQWYPNYDYSAFKWSQATGYVMIGNGVGTGSRASGISANGTTIFGWAQTASTSRSPVVWYNNQAIFINASQDGEAFGASPDGSHVTGTLGSNGFIWTPLGTTTFSNTLMTGSMYPTTILNDGTVFGYIVTGWPPAPNMRRAFVRDSLGMMMTFNDYAAARGLENAQQWLFYSINDASEDGNKLLGAGVNPQGQAVTFIMTFPDPLAIFSANPVSINFGEVPAGTQSDFRNVTLSNAGSGYLQVMGVMLVGNQSERFVLLDNNTYPQSLGTMDSINISVAFAPAGSGLHQAAVEIETGVGTYQVPLTGTGIPGVGVTSLESNSVRVYPVPANQILQVEFLQGMNHIRIFDGLGQLWHQREVNGSHHIVVDVSGFPCGIYSLQISGKNGNDGSARVVVGR